VKWTNKPVLVTGAGGFIGSHLCEALVERGADVVAMTHYNARNDWGNLEFLSPAHRKALRVVAGHIDDPYFVAGQVRGRDIVFHLAALIAIPHSYAAPFAYVRTNIEGTLAVLEACRQHGVERLVHTSTSETYGTAIYTPIDERHPLQGQSPYSASKIGADKMAESYHRSFQLPVATIRPFNTFGPRQSARAVIPTIISQALGRSEIRLGSLEPVRDLTYVADTVRGFLTIAEAPAAIGEVTNIGSGQGITVGDLAARILTIMGRDTPVVSDDERRRPPDSEVMQLICDNRKAAGIGWVPERTLVEGLEATIAFVSEHLHLYKTDQYVV
jgi:NAD dependent epimerase/dehydratase